MIQVALVFFSFERKLGPGAVDREWWKWVEMANARVWIFRGNLGCLKFWKRVSRAPICNVPIYETIHVENVLCPEDPAHIAYAGSYLERATARGNDL